MDEFQTGYVVIVASNFRKKWLKGVYYFSETALSITAV